MASHSLRTPSFHQLSVNSIKVMAHIGCSDKERSVPQEVRVDVHVRLPQFPKAAETDALEDTACYAEITEAIESYFRNNEVQLIERAGYDCYKAIKERIPQDSAVQIRVHKLQPPLPPIKGGSAFVCGDFQ